MSETVTCDLCGGAMTPGTTSLHLWHEQQLVIVCDVPADICKQCGQSHVAQAVSTQIEQFLRTHPECQPQRYIQVPLFSATQILSTE